MGGTRTGRTRSQRLALAVAATLLAAACGGGDSDDPAPTTTEATTAEATAVPETTAGPPTTNDPATVVTETTTSETTSAPETSAAAAPGETPCAAEQAPDGGEYVVTNIPVNDPDGGLVARLLPGTSGERIDVLPEGTVVDSDAERPGCVVTADGGVWWAIDTPSLATGGWVNSRFLAPVGSGDGGGETGDDDFDEELAIIDCVYGGNGESCDLLVTFGIGTADDNYGLGNSYSMAPDDAIVELCTVEGDAIACAEGNARGLLGAE